MIFIQHCWGRGEEIIAQINGLIHKYKLGKFTIEQNQPNQTKQKQKRIHAGSQQVTTKL